MTIIFLKNEYFVPSERDEVEGSGGGEVEVVEGGGTPLCQSVVTASARPSLFS